MIFTDILPEVVEIRAARRKRVGIVPQFMVLILGWEDAGFASRQRLEPSP
jgi:hypothetical protein